MTSLASERSWLLDPGLLKLVHQCRRMIHTEFGVKLHLTEEHLEQRLADYARKTRSSQLIRTWETLKERVPHLDIAETEDDNPEGSKRTYRGQAMPEDSNGKDSHEEGEEARPRRTKVIYRGQVVG
ncbi:hypothetical protein [uncultured Marinobacter sp.]|uniref:hypothetical protein n=1 Tax=uncultured Marinobacter sp. TaxID=187379 RepID=UPI00260AFE78|nr:hypothetical protein [uncultured Marinobacter sp.]MDX1599066.1 hypothetical protein [Marinobacter sp.]